MNICIYFHVFCKLTGCMNVKSKCITHTQTPILFMQPLQHTHTLGGRRERENQKNSKVIIWVWNINSFTWMTYFMNCRNLIFITTTIRWAYIALYCNVIFGSDVSLETNLHIFFSCHLDRSLVIAMILSLIWIAVMRWIAGFMVWLTILLFVAVFGACE